MWNKNWREQIWSDLDQPWDLIVIGGGITGAGILREASRAGLKTLLVEGHDFASGTSSRSSKMVHGGLRYLEMFDAHIDHLAPVPGFKEERRAVIESTFDRLLPYQR